MSKLANIGYIKELMQKHDMNFSKALGQNFLINPSVCPKMAELCDGEDGVIEVGPGVGVLTYELSQVAPKVVSVELDKRLIDLLADSLSECDNVKIIQGDVMKVDLKALIEEEFGDKKVSVCANLPYYITSPVIMMLLEEKLPLKSITVMVQKEAAVRLCAPPGERECGAISAAVRYYCQPEILFDVGRGSFMPAPKVDSAVIKLNIYDTPPVDLKDEKQFFRFVKAAFSKRRKTLVNAVSSEFSKEKVQKALEELNISATIRAEKLSLEELADVANFLTD